MFNLGMGEITVILLLALIFLGPKKLPDLASGLGKLIREIRKATSDVKNEIALDDTFRKPFEELRDAVMLHPDELKRRDQIKQSIEDARKRADELAQQLALASNTPAVEALEAVEGGGDAHATSQELAEGFASPTLPDFPVTEGRHLPPAPEAVIGERPVPAPSMPPAAPRVVSALEAGPVLTPAPTFPSAPPVGTVAAPPTRLGPPRVTPPISSQLEAAGKTQILSEEDLLPANKPPAFPVRKSPPPPLPGLVKPSSPPDPKKA